jgi:hypothetical protein
LIESIIPQRPEYFSPEHWKNICNRVRNIVLVNILPYIKSNRVLSGVISELFETQSEEYFNTIGIPVRSCKNDHEPDLLFLEKNEIVEIKVTSSRKREWMGGKYSKRSSEYVLISWEYFEACETLFGYEEENIKFSVINTYVDESDWNTLGENYYGTKITQKILEGKKIHILV